MLVRTKGSKVHPSHDTGTSNEGSTQLFQTVVSDGVINEPCIVTPNKTLISHNLEDVRRQPDTWFHIDSNNGTQDVLPKAKSTTDLTAIDEPDSKEAHIDIQPSCRNQETISMDCISNKAKEIVNKENTTVTVNFVEKQITLCTTRQPERRRPSFKNCDKFLGQFIIDATTWSTLLCEDGTKLITSMYPQVVSDKFYNITKGCILQMNSYNYKSKKPNQPFTVYGYCGHSTETSFKFTCHVNPSSGVVTFTVFTNVASCIHPCMKTRELSGIHRQKVKQDIVNTNPKLILNTAIRNLDKEGTILNNSQNAKSESVFRKVKSEALAADDLDKDAILDIFKMRDEQSDPATRYVQYVSHPLQVVIFSQDTLLLAVAAKLKKIVTAHWKTPFQPYFENISKPLSARSK